MEGIRFELTEIQYCIAGVLDHTCGFEFEKIEDDEDDEGDEDSEEEVHQCRMTQPVDGRRFGSKGKWTKYESKAQAGRELKVHASSIADCIAGKRDQLRGYQFREGTGAAVSVGKSQGKPVEGRVWKSAERWTKYASTKEAGRILEVDPSSISKCAAGKQNHCGGFEFRFDGEGREEESNEDIAEDTEEDEDAEGAINQGMGGARRLVPVDGRRHGSKDEWEQYTSIAQAARTLDVGTKKIRDCIAGTRKQGHVKGFEFRKGARRGGIFCKPVEGRRQDSSDPWVTYESVSGATRALGFKNACNISKCLTSRKNRTGGYEFRWPDNTTMKRKASKSKQRQVHRQGKMQDEDDAGDEDSEEEVHQRRMTQPVDGRRFGSKGKWTKYTSSGKVYIYMQRGDVVSKGRLNELSSERDLNKKEQAWADLVAAGWIITAKSNFGHYTYDSPRGKR
jgi:hypothetical protein